MSLRGHTVGSVATGLLTLLLVFSTLTPVAAITTSNASSVSSTNSTAEILKPLQPFLDAFWPGKAQNSTFVHPPITDAQVSNGTVCPYASALSINATGTAQNASNTIIKPRQGVIRVMVVGDSITQGK